MVTTTVVFNLVKTIIFLVFRSINMTCEHGMSTLLAILVLRDTRIYVSLFDDGNMWTSIKTLVD